MPTNRPTQTTYRERHPKQSVTIEYSVECPFCDLTASALTPTLALSAMVIHLAEMAGDTDHNWNKEPNAIVIRGNSLQLEAYDASIAWSTHSGRIGPYNPMTEVES